MKKQVFLKGMYTTPANNAITEVRLQYTTCAIDELALK